MEAMTIPEAIVLGVTMAFMAIMSIIEQKEINKK